MFSLTFCISWICVTGSLIFECFSGSILAVTTADPNASGKTNRFVGICIQRGGKGLGATFILRNIINGQGELRLTHGC